MASAAGDEVPNKMVILKRYVTGFPSEDDMEVVTGTARLAVPPGSPAMVVKNLYVSCDPYMRGRMTKHERPSYVPDFVLGEALVNFGVGKVMASGHPDYKVGDLVWGMTGWEEYTLVPKPETFFKINHPEFPLSYYTGVLGPPMATSTRRSTTAQGAPVCLLISDLLMLVSSVAPRRVPASIPAAPCHSLLSAKATTSAPPRLEIEDDGRRGGRVGRDKIWCHRGDRRGGGRRGGAGAAAVGANGC